MILRKKSQARIMGSMARIFGVPLSRVAENRMDGSSGGLDYLSGCLLGASRKNSSFFL
jgi:hypothetical protein